jgi:hypothetical protein
MHRIALTAALIALGVGTLASPASAQSHHGHGHRLLISLSFNSDLDHRVGDVARDAFERTLRDRIEVVVNVGDARAAQHAMRTQHLRGHFFQANVRATPARRGAIRIAVSIVVSTLEGRELEFESEAAVTISTDSVHWTDDQLTAIQRAVASATTRSIDQLLAGA